MIKYQNLMPMVEYNGVTISDITHRFQLCKVIKEYASSYHKIDLMMDETAEQLSSRVYGSSNYWWLILATNDIIDPIYDWLMSDEECIAYATKLFGEEGINNIHHYEDEYFVHYEENSPEEDRTPITEVENILKLNDEKRKVYIISKKHLPAIEKELNLTMKRTAVQTQEIK